MCVTSLLCGPREDLWPFYGFYVNGFLSFRAWATCVETFRFKDEDDYEYEIWLKVFTGILKI